MFVRFFSALKTIRKSPTLWLIPCVGLTACSALIPEQKPALADTEALSYRVSRVCENAWPIDRDALLRQGKLYVVLKKELGGAWSASYEPPTSVSAFDDDATEAAIITPSVRDVCLATVKYVPNSCREEETGLWRQKGHFARRSNAGYTLCTSNFRQHVGMSPFDPAYVIDAPALLSALNRSGALFVAEQKRLELLAR